MIRVLIIADDLSGAADAAAPFAHRGLPSAVQLRPPGDRSLEVLALTTSSRDLPETQAVQSIQRLSSQEAYSSRLTERQAGGPPLWVYKKIDSTLRGHPGAELNAVMEALGETRALISPAFPAQGRTTRAGVQHVNGQPMDAASWGAASADLPTVFGGFGWDIRSLDLGMIRRGAAEASRELEKISSGWVIADAERDRDLEVLAQAATAAGWRLLCGSAGFAQALANCLPPMQDTDIRFQSSRSGPVLVVAGSRNPQTIRQLDYLAASRVPLIQLEPDYPHRTIEKLRTVLHDQPAAALVCSGLTHRPGGQVQVAGALGGITAALAEHEPLGGLVLTGGDTAAAVLAALDVSAYHLLGEVQGGIPWGYLEGGSLPELPVITKAGGFGGREALTAAICHLQGDQQGSNMG